MLSDPQLDLTRSRALLEDRAFDGKGPKSRTVASGFRAHPRVDDIRLAARAAAGDELARQAVEALLDEAADLLRAEPSVQEVVEPALEAVTERILDDRAGRPAGIVAYRGRGRLGAWLRKALVAEIVRRRSAHAL